MKIGKRIISNKNNPFIIGEIGINHNGLLANAIKLIDHAKNAGFEAVKFQTYNTDSLLKKKHRYRYTFLQRKESTSYSPGL